MPPAVSEAQRRYMAMCAKNPSMARGKCPSKQVAKEFMHKPKGGYKKKDNPGYGRSPKYY